MKRVGPDLDQKGGRGKETIIIPIPSLHPFRNFSITKETVMAMEGLQPKETRSSPQPRGKVPISQLGRSEACEDLHCANGIAPGVGAGLMSANCVLIPESILMAT